MGRISRACNAVLSREPHASAVSYCRVQHRMLVPVARLARTCVQTASTRYAHAQTSQVWLSVFCSVQQLPLDLAKHCRHDFASRPCHWLKRHVQWSRGHLRQQIVLRWLQLPQLQDLHGFRVLQMYRFLAVRRL